ncbi:MAG: hypothetical protein EA363_06375 [Balneolaceae bacterium]|nr:MAG: hypothetical protein EA363_06375 [Balneolaceae bacterium]
MSTFLQIIVVFDAIFFLIYGLQCFISPAMALEFKRFGLSDSQRQLTGALQLSGSAGLVTGLFIPVIGTMASGGLAMMMLVAFLVRMKIRDGFWESAPSILFLALNGWISWNFYALFVSGIK